jgi:hypothetical protein
MRHLTMAGVQRLAVLRRSEFVVRRHFAWRILAARQVDLWSDADVWIPRT